MEFDLYVLTYILEAIVIGIVFFAIYQNKKDKYTTEIRELKNSLEKTERKYKKSQVEIKSTQTRNTTSYIEAEIKKREKLELEIEKLKNTIVDTKTIAQDASMVKTEFLSNIRHEIRTPLNAILVFADMLKNEIQDKRLNSFAHNIDASGHKLLLLLDNIIELSSIESDSFELEEKAIDTQSYFNSIIELYKENISQKGLDLFIEIDSKLPRSLMLDESRVKEIVENLISNAIKFTDNGFIKLSVDVIGSDISLNSVDIAVGVEDSGIGLSVENQTKIFEIFEKKDNCNEIEFEGTGLGLSINRKLAQLMNGKLEVESEVSKGSKFILTLQGVEVVLNTDESLVEDTELDFSLIRPDGAKVLFVDDGLDNVQLIKESFSNSNVEVIDFDNARDAIGYLQSHSVDLILIDVNILSVDSAAVSKVIQKISGAEVVTLTDSRLKGIDFGVGGVKPVGHLQKPLSKTALFAIALKVLNSSNKYQQDESKTKADEDDKSFDLENIRMFLEENELIYTNLYIPSRHTNDLNTITKFAEETLKVASKYSIDDIVHFTKLLLDKIELFEIDSINDMLKMYEAKIKRCKSFLKE